MKQFFAILKFSLVLLLIYFNSVNYLSAQRLLAIPPPFLWYLADSINNEQNYWVDLRSHQNNVYFNTPIEIGKINYQSSIKVTTTIPLSIPYQPKSKDAICMFAVYKTDTSQNGYSIWSIRLDSSSFIEMNSNFVRDFLGKKPYSSNSGSSAQLNLLKTNWSGQTIDTLYSHLNLFGGDSIQSFSGLLSEIIFYNHKLSYKEIAKVSTYLAIKYGISLQNINYVRSDNAILWDVRKNSAFSNEIAGIGKDFKLRINQKQSGGNGGESILKISANTTFSNWNKENDQFINDGDFLIWGDNGKNFFDYLTDTLNTDTANSIYLTNHSERKWKMKRTGKTAHNIPTLVMLTAPELARDTTKSVTLVISRTANIHFPIDSCLFIPADSTDSLGNLYFHNVYWDTDSSGSDAFTFQFNDVYQNQQNITIRSASADSIVNDGTSLIQLYPNPSNGWFNVDVKLKEPGNASLSVHDESGRVVFQKQLINEQEYLERIELNTKGLYFLSIETNGKKQHFNIVVE